MKRPIALFIMLAVTSPAFAQAGDHHGFDLWAALAHLLTQPFHVAMLVVAFGAGLLLAGFVRRRARTHSPDKDER